VCVCVCVCVFACAHRRMCVRVLTTGVNAIKHALGACRLVECMGEPEKRENKSETGQCERALAHTCENISLAPCPFPSLLTP